MDVRYDGCVAILTPADSRGNEGLAEELERALEVELNQGFSVVINGQNWRAVDIQTRGALIGAVGVFDRAGRSLMAANLDKQVQFQLGEIMLTEPTVEIAVAVIQRAAQFPAASK